jgi:hypothetical protein
MIAEYADNLGVVVVVVLVGPGGTVVVVVVPEGIAWQGL